MKRKIFIGIIVIAAIITLSGATFLVVAHPGSQDDPFVTLSYLTNIFRPQMMTAVTEAEGRLSGDVNTRVSGLEQQIHTTHGVELSALPGSAHTFSVVTLSRNQILTASVGTEIMLRVGTATARGTAPALVNYTNGTTLYAAGALVTNHMYLVTIEGNGITATDDLVRVLVRGSFTVS
jgi:hypothetical protein